MTSEAVIEWLQQNETEGREAIVTALQLKGRPAQVVRKFKKRQGKVEDDSEPEG